jgi:transcriptional regulator with XRE-family HTH domain
VQIDDQLQQRFGARLRKLREATGESQEAFGLRCGLDRTYVSGIERGRSNPTLQVLLIIAQGLNTTVANITRGIDSE